MADLELDPTATRLLAAANAAQERGDAPAALRHYGELREHLMAGRQRGELGRVLFQMAQLCRYEGRHEEALAHYDDLLQLVEAATDPRAHGLGLAMRGQLIFLRGAQSRGLTDMVRGLELLLQCHAAEAEHLTCHTRYFGRRLPRGEYVACVEAATDNVVLRRLLVAEEGC